MSSFILNNTSSKTDLGILNFIKKIDNKENITFTTSGTTSEPKVITHNYNLLTKNIKIKDEFKNVIWGLTYDYTKIAGAQVILQSYLNNSKIVNLYQKTPSEIIYLINKYNITHLSATPTFYKLLGKNIFKTIIQVTLGGEPVDENLILYLKTIFPNAKIKNIYALTEYGTLFASNDSYFTLSDKNNHFIKIENNTLYVKYNNKWENTGDIIEWIDNLKFKIIGRETNMINVGGIKINPIKVENIINSLNYVVNSYVYSTPNSVMGNIVCADIIIDKEISLKTLKQDLKNTTISKYEFPLKINLVNQLQTTSTGKIIRK